MTCSLAIYLKVYADFFLLFTILVQSAFPISPPLSNGHAYTVYMHLVCMNYNKYKLTVSILPLWKLFYLKKKEKGIGTSPSRKMLSLVFKLSINCKCWQWAVSHSGARSKSSYQVCCHSSEPKNVRKPVCFML